MWCGLSSGGLGGWWWLRWYGLSGTALGCGLGCLFGGGILCGSGGV